MSVSFEVKRTLVKSPPELWAELSDPAALARHLGELGEIQIVRTEPEQAVDWEAPQISGTVRIEPSGWGTKVTLTAIRSFESAAPQRLDEDGETEIEEIVVDEAHVEPATEAGALLEVGGAFEVEPDPASYAEYDPQPASPYDLELPAECDLELEPDLEPEAEAGVAPAFEFWSPATAEVEPRRGFFARLFRRQPKIQPPPGETIEPEPRPVLPEPELAVEPSELELAAEAEPAGEVEPALEPATVAEPPYTSESESPQELEPGESAREETDITAELAQLEEQTTAVLVAVLDRLGAAHHRPFSRA
jgi:hypothetical protein